MSRIWSTEAPALMAAALALAILGLLIGNWFLACLLTLGGYILWLYHRLVKLEKWINQGTKASQVYDDDGFVGIIIRQLYQQKKNYNQRKKRTKAILRQLNRNISALPDATVLLNDELEIVWCNEPARYLLNIRSPHDLGSRIGNLLRAPEFLAYLRDIDSREYIEIPSPGDQQITVQIQISSIGSGQLLLIARNVSDQKRLQESLKNFVANASHELKSPLTVITGHLEMLEGEPLSEAGKGSLLTAQRQAARMRELIQSLLLLSQVESYQLRPGEGERIPIAEIMTNTIAAMDKYPDRARVEWYYPQDLFLLGIKAEIEGICINLVENALKYSTPDTPIRVSWEKNLLGEYQFIVSDQGPGIDPQDMPRLTERYYRAARSAAETAGSGLGLAIVQQAASKHGATLEIDSSPGGSTTFTVSFPSYRCLVEERQTARVIHLADY
ncbi:MAG: phosphate regulon sensor protein PhoR [Gammaproteobacteria bacterium]|jgi:two-component system phosphate regulon sensor histidine kinase PhoR